jgi:transcriptional regulator GlxA family with amidase domain
MNSAVEHAAKCMWEHYSEPLTLADIAKSAMLSRFHFSRIFWATISVTHADLSLRCASTRPSICS